MALRYKTSLLLLGLVATAFAAQTPPPNPEPVFDPKAPRLLATAQPATDAAKKLLAGQGQIDAAAAKKEKLQVVPFEGFTALVDERLVGEEYAVLQMQRMAGLSQALAINRDGVRLDQLPKESADALRSAIRATGGQGAKAASDPGLQIAAQPCVQMVMRGPNGKVAVEIFGERQGLVDNLAIPTANDVVGVGVSASNEPETPGPLESMHLLYQKGRWSRAERTRATRLLVEWLDDRVSKLDAMFRKSADALRMALWQDNSQGEPGPQNPYSLGAIPPGIGQSYGEFNPCLQYSAMRALQAVPPYPGAADAAAQLASARLTAMRIQPMVTCRGSDGSVMSIGIDLVLW